MSDTTDQQKQKRCMILIIAPELRNRIYNELFQEDNTVTVDEDYCLPSILKTCKTIHYEAINMYYASTTFEYTHTHYASPHDPSLPYAPIIKNWLRPLPANYRNLIKKLRYYSDEFNDLIESVHRLRAKKLRGCPFETSDEYVPECDSRGAGITLDNHFICVGREMAGLLRRSKVEVPWMYSEPYGDLRCWKSLEQIDEYFDEGWWIREGWNTGVYWI